MSELNPSPCCTPGVHGKAKPRPPKITASETSNINLVPISGGLFRMGCDDSPHPEDGEGPSRDVIVDDFLIAPMATTNEEFAHFVDVTQYRTEAEIAGASWVFDPNQSGAGERLPHAPWWRYAVGASWKNPHGHDTLPEPRHPVVQVSHRDALAYAKWTQSRLPTEAEWEYAARGGLEGAPFPWGNTLQPLQQHRCNIWQGRFPHENSTRDGYMYTAPVDSFEPNGYHLYNMTGNTWEWVADRFTRLHSPKLSRNPTGPLSGQRYVMKGGSFLCHDSYCKRYRTSSRTANLPNARAANLGFRIARSIAL